MNARSQTLRNTLFSTVGIYTEFFLGMLTSILIARHLGPHEFGTYSLVIWFVAIGVAVTNSGTAGAAIRFIAELRGGGNDHLIRPLLEYLRRAQRLFLLVVVLAMAAVVVFGGERLTPALDPRLLVGLLAVSIALRATYMFTIGVAKGFENFRTTAAVALVATPLNLAMVAVAWWVDAPMEAFLAIFLVSGVVFYWASTRRVEKLLPPTTPDAVLPEDLLARVRRHMFISAFMVTVTFVTASDVEVLFLNMLDTARSAGHFKVAHQLASGASILVPGVFSALLLPMMAGALAKGQEVAGRRFVASTNYLALLAAPVIAFGVVFAGPVIITLYGVKYSESATAFAALLTAYAFTAISSAGSSLLISADRQHTVLKLVAAAGALKVLLDVVLIHRFGFIGAVIASSTALVVNSTLMMVLAMRAIHTSLDWLRLLRIAFAALLTAAIAMPAHLTLPPVQALLVGALVTSITYPLLTLVLRCWSREDIAHVQAMHARARSRPRALATLLRWAHARAPGEPA